MEICIICMCTVCVRRHFTTALEIEWRELLKRYVFYQQLLFAEIIVMLILSHRGFVAKFSSVQDGICTWKSPYICSPPCLTEVSPMLPLKVSVFPWLTMALSCPFKEDHIVIPFPCLSPQGEWCSYVLGFVPAGSVSSSSTLQIFQDTSHLWWLLCLTVCLLGHFSSLWRVHRSFRGGSRPLAHSSLGFPINVKMWLTCDQLWFLILCW